MTNRPGFSRLFALALLSGACTFSPVRCGYLRVGPPTCDVRSGGSRGEVADAEDALVPRVTVREGNGLVYLRVIPREADARDLRIGLDGAEPRWFGDGVVPVRADSGPVEIEIHYRVGNGDIRRFRGELDVPREVGELRAGRPDVTETLAGDIR